MKPGAVTTARKDGRSCPICGRPSAEATRPFCSPRCNDVDLHRWLAGTYVIPGEEAADPDLDPDEAA